MYLAVFLTLISLYVSVLEGAVVKFERKTPTASNNDSCGVITCQHTLQKGDLYVQEIRLYNIAGTGSSRLLTVEADNCKHGKGQEVILVSRSFSRSNVSVVVGVRGASICNEGDFMCEVVYVNEQLENAAEVVIVKSNSIPTMDGLCKKLNDITSTVQALQNQLANLTEYANTQNVCGIKSTYPEGRLAFRGTSGVRISVYQAYKTGDGLPDQVDTGCKQVGRSLPCRSHYRNKDILDNWRNISQVTLAVYKDNVKVKQINFNAVGSNYMNWFAKDRVIESSWTDMKSAVANYFSIDGDQNTVLKRTFFMNNYYYGCPNDIGWFAALDVDQAGCEWEKNDGFPAFKYSIGDEMINWNNAGVAWADYFAIFVK